MKTHDFAYPRGRTIVFTKRKTATAIIDSLIAGLVIGLFVLLVFSVSYLIFG